jgi:hypothetical protein
MDLPSRVILGLAIIFVSLLAGLGLVVWMILRQDLMRRLAPSMVVSIALAYVGGHLAFAGQVTVISNLSSGQDDDSTVPISGGNAARR